MRLHEVPARFSDIIRSYETLQYEIAHLNSRLKLKIVFANGSELYVRDILLDGRRRKYACHWQEESGRLIPYPPFAKEREHGRHGMPKGVS
jgi:hypothetical protein